MNLPLLPTWSYMSSVVWPCAAITAVKVVVCILSVSAGNYDTSTSRPPRARTYRYTRLLSMYYLPTYLPTYFFHSQPPHTLPKNTPKGKMRKTGKMTEGETRSCLWYFLL